MVIRLVWSVRFFDTLLCVTSTADIGPNSGLRHSSQRKVSVKSKNANAPQTQPRKLPPIHSLFLLNFLPISRFAHCSHRPTLATSAPFWTARLTMEWRWTNPPQPLALGMVAARCGVLRPALCQDCRLDLAKPMQQGRRSVGPGWERWRREGVGSWYRESLQEKEKRPGALMLATATIPLQPVRGLCYCLLLMLRWMRVIYHSKKSRWCTNSLLRNVFSGGPMTNQSGATD
jgi:hypothetical protein